MQYYTIQHNPFFLKTEVFRNNEITTDEDFSSLKNIRFQNIVDQIPQQFDIDANENLIKIKFVGRTYEFDDLSNACQHYSKEKKVVFELLHEEKYDNIDINKVRSLANLLEESPIDSINNEKIVEEFLGNLDNQFDIAVIAPVSSGKSTLINAMLGVSMLPARNEATTAKIYRIKNIDGQKESSATVYNKECGIIDQHDQCDVDILNTFNENEEVSEIHIDIDFPNISSEVMNLVLIDTPGTNNSQDTRHKEVTYKLIKDNKNSPIVLFVLDATKQRVEDENELLRVISDEINIKHPQQARERFIFVLNKADTLKENEVTDAINKTKDYLSRMHNIDNPNIFVVSSEEALIIRKLQKNQVLDKSDEFKPFSIKGMSESDEYSYRWFEKYAPLSNSNKRIIGRSVQEAKENNDWHKQALHHSGITALEMVINDYVTKYAIPIKVKEAFKKIEKIVNTEEMENALNEEAQKDETKRVQYENELNEISKRVNKIGSIEKFKKKIGSLKLKIQPIKRLRKDIAKKFTDLYMMEIFKKDYPIIVAEQMTAIALEKIDTIKVNIQMELYRQLQEELRFKADAIIEEFKSEIKELFAIKNIDSLAFQAQTLVISDMPTSDRLIQMAKEEKSIQSTVTKIKDREADMYDYISLGIARIFRENKEKYKVKVTTKHDVSNYKKLKSEFKKINEQFLSDIDSFEKLADDLLEQLKTSFELVIDEFMEKINIKIKEQKELMRDKKALELKLESNKKHMQWLENYKKAKKTIYKEIQ